MPNKKHLADLDSGTAVDFYFEGRKICWTDGRQSSILCATYNNSHIGPKSTVVEGNINLPDGLACDWLTQKLYWTDGESNRIEVVSLDGKFRKVLFWEDLDQPRAIVLVPTESIMFWTDWGEVPKIERAGMNGDPQTRKIIVSEKIFWPNGITADYDSKKLYWLDGKLLFIEVMDYDGKNRKKILEGDHGSLRYPYSVTFFKEKLYWTDWETWSIHMLDRSSKSNRELIHIDHFVPVDIRVMDQSRQPFKSTPCSVNNGGCSHLCLLSPNSPGYSCACPTGVRLIDSHQCADGPQEIILLAQLHGISLISLDSPDYTMISLDLKGIKHAMGLDYDPVNDYIYWTDHEARIIRRVHLNGTGQQDVISSELRLPDGVAIDWRAQNLYWTDSETDRIQVLRINTPYTKVLINTELREPRGIAVSPDEGLMFWSDWFEPKPKIERSVLDGSSRTLLVGDHLGWPNNLALDIPARRVYWCDAKTDKIEVVSYDGTDRKEIITNNIPHLFGISLSGDYLYWTDWQRRSIESGHKETGDNRKIIQEHVASVMGLKVINLKEMQPSNNPCSMKNGNCAHLCLNTPSKYVCACQMGYELESNGRTCVEPEAFLLFTRKDNIGRISIENAHNDAIIPASGVKDASALDFDIRESRIYWTDVKAKALTRAYVNGSNVEKIIEYGLDSPEGLAVDWVSHNIYWTDTGTKRIEVARVDGKYRRPVLWRGLHEPRSIAVDPNREFIYWSDWAGSGSLHRAQLNGNNPKALIPKLGRVNSLTIDLLEGRIYWCAIQGHIESANMDGSRRTIVATSQRPFTMSLYQDKIYWSDWETGELNVASKHGGNKTLLHSNLEQVTSVVVYHEWGRQVGWSPCTSTGGQCPHLCLGGHCTCQAHYTNHEGKCLPPSSFMLVSTKNSISRLMIDTDECPDSPLPLHSLRNVKVIEYDPLHNTLFWLDGKPNANAIKKWTPNNGPNGGPGTVSVVVGQNHHPTSFTLDPVYRVIFWSCASEGTINATRLDNGSSPTVLVVQTHSTEKPRHLAVHPLKGFLFWTTEGRDYRIYKSRMDGFRRVMLFSESRTIISMTIDTAHNTLYWSTISSIESCDMNGKNRVVLTTGEKFNSISVYGKYIYWLSGTMVMSIATSGGHVEPVWTSQHHLTALAAVSTPSKKVQNTVAYWDCVNGIRVASHTECTREGPCTPDNFSCASSVGDCIPMKWRCDLADDCLDGSDEANCPQCGPDKFTCQPSFCIDMKYVCDGHPHCPDNADERSCCDNAGWHQCSTVVPAYGYPSTLHTGLTCLPPHFVCDGLHHCDDRSDETNEACLKKSMHVTQESQGYVLLAAFVIAGFLIIMGYGVFRWKTRTSKGDNGVQVGDPALDPLSPKGMRNCGSAACGAKGYPAAGGHSCVLMSTLQRSTSCSQPSSNSLLCYPLNPPPSPATTSKETTRLGLYRPPPPTPCSTDVCHETDSNYQGESEPLPPPPTPTSASPSPSSSTYFHPTPPPPSPTC
ncbi:hypothetical protein GE061_006527 [Apolygus lucorum]|uniref:EGF-like domain-containing protein n=1 Tax=Apolygus lucorum TaxID=248454 RepID=A0A8S9WVI2_APOLU|nr:hypothetical protein GE061_006527 [Apolygus lucorum]